MTTVRQGSTPWLQSMGRSSPRKSPTVMWRYRCGRAPSRLTPTERAVVKWSSVSPSGDDVTRKVNATYTREGAKLNMQWEGAGKTAGTFEGDSFSMNNEGMIFAYKKQPATPASQDSSARPPGMKALERLLDELDAVQGEWVRTLEGEEAVNAERAVKEIKGNKETITHYRKDGEIVAQWTVDFKLEKTEKIRLFTWQNLVVTNGQGKGRTLKGPFSYIYRVTDDAFVEIQGLLIGQSRKPAMRVWKRAKQESEE